MALELSAPGGAIFGRHQRRGFERHAAPFSGFDGAEWADSLRIVEEYINGVSDDARGVTAGRPQP